MRQGQLEEGEQAAKVLQDVVARVVERTGTGAERVPVLLLWMVVQVTTYVLAYLPKTSGLQELG